MAARERCHHGSRGGRAAALGVGVEETGPPLWERTPGPGSSPTQRMDGVRSAVPQPLTYPSPAGPAPDRGSPLPPFTSGWRVGPLLRSKGLLDSFCLGFCDLPGLVSPGRESF